MAITKRFKVSFDMKVVVGTDEMALFEKQLLKLAHKVQNGEKVSGIDREFLRVSLTEGVEAAAAFAIQQGVRQWIRKELPEDNVTCSPATVRVVK